MWNINSVELEWPKQIPTLTEPVSHQSFLKLFVSCGFDNNNMSIHLRPFYCTFRVDFLPWVFGRIHKLLACQNKRLSDF